jgi:hypothetical protein
MSDKREVNITLTKSEVLVLFELLTRYSNGEIDQSLTVLDHAERQALWNLCCCFEKELAEPFSPKYAEFLAAAKADLTCEDSPPFRMDDLVTIYMPLLNEGTDVWRPATARRQKDGSYLVVGPVPEDEEWMFLPGSRVRCEFRQLSGSYLVPVAHR